MKELVIYLIASVFIVSCSEKPVTKQVTNECKIDSLVIRNTEKDSVIDLLITQLNDLRTLRYSDGKSENVLYGVVKPVPVNDFTFAKLINSFDTTISHWNGEYYTRIVKACNGQADLSLEYCNCSDNIYVSTGSPDIPEEYYLFKIGPYMEVVIDSLDREKSELIFHHKIKDKIKSERLKINLTNVKLISN